MIQNSYFQLRFKPFSESARLDLGTIFVLLLAGILSLPVIRIQCTVYLISKMLIGFEHFFDHVILTAFWDIFIYTVREPDKIFTIYRTW